MLSGNTPSPKLEQVALSGNERFKKDGNELPYSALDFWRWASSDLASNATRGVLAEFIVAKMLGIELATRNEWDDFDLITPDGTKIEVKSSAYIQSWHQKKHSAPKFDIAKRKYYTDPATGEYKKYDTPRRTADLYIFALMKGMITQTSDPLDLDHWEFYQLTREVIDQKFGDRKSVGLRELRENSVEEKNKAMRYN